ncbi:hypothetical protein [Mycobacterium sp. DL99]|uniref:hypothetical protein n=1 Tax=Mycobacterium sp. DL99 TaxID=2528957 RepID=UPI0014369E43|nr:hypothetical protein [Mycobacterium sp. DL99]
MRKLGAKGRLAILGVVLVLGLTCCQFRGSWSAGLIDNVLRRQPGVTFVTHTVTSNSGFGVRTAGFDVYVGADTTADQLSALGRTFADQIHRSMVYGGLGAGLNVRRSAQSFPAQTGSTMYVNFEPLKTTPEPPWRDWLKLSQGDYAYEIVGSASPDGAWQPARTSLTVTLRSFGHRDDPLSASEFAASVRRLVTDFPDSTADWSIFDADTNGAPGIRSNHGLPDPEQLALWEALDQLAPTKGEFDLKPPRFSIQDVPADPDADRVLIEQLQLIKNSELPTVYEVEDAQITVRPGGCSADAREPQPRTPPMTDLQTGLRTQFESCPP